MNPKGFYKYIKILDVSQNAIAVHIQGVVLDKNFLPKGNPFTYCAFGKQNLPAMRELINSGKIIANRIYSIQTEKFRVKNEKTGLFRDEWMWSIVAEHNQPEL